MITRWARFIEWFSAGLLIVYVVVIIAIGAPPPWLLLILVAAIAIPLIQFRVLRPIARRAREANLCLCPQCGNPFEGEGNRACANCSFEFDSTTARRLWRTAVLRYHRGGRSAKIEILNRKLILIVVISFSVLPILGIFVTFGALYLYEQKYQTLPNINGYLITMPTIILQLLAVTSFVLLGISDRRKIDRAHDHDFLLCPKCTFPLDGIRDAQACPECGATFHSDDLRRRWYEAWVNRRNFREAIEMDIPLMIRDDDKS